MTADKRLNLWMASDIADRNAISATQGLALGDFCLVDGVNLYVVTAMGPPVVWRPMAGLPTSGPFGLGGANNADTTARRVFVLSAVTFRAVLEGTPSSVTLTPGANQNWPTLPTVITWSATGFTLSGSSNVIAAGLQAWTRGTYDISY